MWAYCYWMGREIEVWGDTHCVREPQPLILGWVARFSFFKLPVLTVARTF